MGDWQWRIRERAQQAHGTRRRPDLLAGCQEDLAAAEAEARRYREALEHYADLRHWAINRHPEYEHPKFVYIGALTKPTIVADEALAGSQPDRGRRQVSGDAA